MLELLGVPVPAADTHPIEGTSLVPLLAAGESSGDSSSGSPASSSARGTEEWTKSVALTTYPRCPGAGRPSWDGNDCIHSTERTEFEFMGYSIRIDHSDGCSYRFTDWYPWNGTSLSPILTPSMVRATELYNHSVVYPMPVSEFDGFEVKNIAPSNQELVGALRHRLQVEFALA